MQGLPAIPKKIVKQRCTNLNANEGYRWQPPPVSVVVNVFGRVRTFASTRRLLHKKHGFKFFSGSAPDF